jgi:hypothetical protein
VSAARYWHTLRHLQRRQIFGRVWFRLHRPTPDLRPAPPVRQTAQPWRPVAWREPSLLSPVTVKFLNVTGEIGAAIGWNDMSQSRLWRYHLHYFDDLTSRDFMQRAPWHGALLDRWVRENPPGRGTGWDPYPETTSGGNALKFYASVRLDIRRIGAIKDRDEVVGNQTRVKVVKNKLAPPFKQVEFDIMYGEGVSKMGELVDLGVKAGVVEKSGSWFSYDSQRIGQGRENAKVFLKQNPEVAARIESAVRQNAGLIAEQILGNTEADSDSDDEDAAEA